MAILLAYLLSTSSRPQPKMSAAYTLKPCPMQTTDISFCFRNNNSDTFGTKYT